jgi:hypothetical protein
MGCMDTLNVTTGSAFAAIGFSSSDKGSSKEIHLDTAYYAGGFTVAPASVMLTRHVELSRGHWRAPEVKMHQWAHPL